MSRARPMSHERRLASYGTRGRPEAQTGPQSRRIIHKNGHRGHVRPEAEPARAAEPEKDEPQPKRWGIDDLFRLRWPR